MQIRSGEERLAGKAIKGLREEALHTAKNIDPEDLATENGIIRLVAEIEKSVLPRRKEEARKKRKTKAKI